MRLPRSCFPATAFLLLMHTCVVSAQEEKSEEKKGEEKLHKVKKSKKQILSAFPDAENELSSYIKAEKIDLKNEADLVKLLRYYDSLSAE